MKEKLEALKKKYGAEVDRPIAEHRALGYDPLVRLELVLSCLSHLKTPAKAAAKKTDK